jgi:hypothetical protein
VSDPTDPFTMTPAQAAARAALRARLAARHVRDLRGLPTDGVRVELHTEPPPPPEPTPGYARTDFPVRWPDTVVHRSAPYSAPDPLTDLDWTTPVHTDPQTQGDVIVLAWLETTVPSWRAQEVDAAAPLPDGGLPVDPGRSHWVLPEPPLGTRAFWNPGRGHRLGTLVVPDGARARLSHTEHADLLIGPGVYVVRLQRTIPATSRAPRPATD